MDLPFNDEPCSSIHLIHAGLLLLQKAMTSFMCRPLATVVLEFIEESGVGIIVESDGMPDLTVLP